MIISCAIPKDCRDYDYIISHLIDVINQLLPYTFEKMLNSDVVKYKLDTGQSVVETDLKTSDDFTKTIMNIEKMIKFYEMLRDRQRGLDVIQLQDASNFNRNGII